MDQKRLKIGRKRKKMINRRLTAVWRRSLVWVPLEDQRITKRLNLFGNFSAKRIMGHVALLGLRAWPGCSCGGGDCRCNSGTSCDDEPMDVRLLKRSCCLILSTFLLAGPAMAWGGDAHQIVCLIAEKGLSKEANAMIASLLDGAEISDGEIASWADQIRQDRPESGPWHYVNIQITAKSYDPKRDGNAGNNVVDKVEEFAKVVADRNQTKAKRAEALKFLVHLVGDIHQPMHCGDRNDRGGNTRLVFFLDQSEALSLHKVWDSEILWHHKGPMRVADYADVLLTKIDKPTAAKWAGGNPVEWANESLAISRDVAYANVRADGAPPKLDQAYVDKASTAVDMQLTKAGIRLANLLNRIAR